MADETQQELCLFKRATIELVIRLFILIENNSFEEIRKIFEPFRTSDCIKILNTSIHRCTLLYAAVRLNNLEISDYLLKLSLVQGNLAVTERWKSTRHPLSCAILQGNLFLIEMILQHLPDIDDNINGVYTPLMSATAVGNLNTVKLIVTMGADINRPSFQGRVPLMESTSNSEICRFLIRQGANFFHQDKEGFTALHFAIARNHEESITVLVNAGADLRVRTHEGITPLIWACIKLNLSAVKYLIPHPDYTLLDKIEALEILNACYICSGKIVIELWRKALCMRNLKCLPKICPIFTQKLLDFSEEFQTEKQLVYLQDKPLYLAFQSILVVERILGRNNRLYLQVLLQTALIAKKENNMKVRQLIDYIQEYYQVSSVSFVASNLSYFKSLFNEICNSNHPRVFIAYGGFAIFTFIANATVDMWKLTKKYIHKNHLFYDSYYSKSVDAFLYMMSITNTQAYSNCYRLQFKAMVKKVIREDLRLRYHQSILHRAIKLMKKLPFNTIYLIKTLLEYGADPNCSDFYQRTPIMYAVEHAPDHIVGNVVELLMMYGGQLDFINSEGFTAMDYPSWGRCLFTPTPQFA